MSDQCTGKTKTGTRCKREPIEGGDRCFQHFPPPPVKRRRGFVNTLFGNQISEDNTEFRSERGW
jgi:hypothetical protein